MKSPARLDRAIRDLIEQINSEPISGILNDPPVREAFAILHALQWVQGKRMVPPEVRVNQLLSRAKSGLRAA
jgi:hypothetical protein